MTKTKTLTKNFEVKSFDRSETKEVKPLFKKKHRKGKRKFIKNEEDTLKLYLQVAQVLDNMKDGEISFKDAFFKSNTQPDLKRNVYALGSKVVSNWKLLNQIVDESGILVENPGENKNAIKVIIADYLWGCKQIIGKEWIFDVVREKKNELDEIKQKFGNFQDKNRPTDLTFVKVNTIKYKAEDFKKYLENLNFECISTPKNYENFMDLLSKLKLKSNAYMVDFHFKDLFIFPISAKSKICEDEIFKNKSITIQDKSSLIPVSLLQVEQGSTVLDMCAAPGMKTVYIAAQLKGNGEVLAVDRDKRRYQTLVSMVKSFGANKIVKTFHNDITKFECDEQSVDFVLLDAPCSGSGIRDRLGETVHSKERLRSLQWLQHKMLTQALTKYTNAKRIVYSTCSKFTEENEAVIDMTLKQLKGNIRFKLVDCHQLIKGYSKGSTDYKFGHLCLKVDTEKDYSNGFFTAVFENKGDDSEGESEENEEENSQERNSEEEKSEDDNSEEEKTEDDNSKEEESEEEKSEDDNSTEEESEEEKSEDENCEEEKSEDEISEEESSEDDNSKNMKIKGAKSNKSLAKLKTNKKSLPMVEEGKSLKRGSLQDENKVLPKKKKRLT